MLKIITMIAALVFVGGCGTSPKASYYTLEAEGRLASGQGTAPSVLLVAASLPELLDRPQMVLRGAANQVVLSDLQRWAEPLRSSIPRVVAADLGRRLNSANVAALPAGAPYFDADFRLTLHVQRLDAQPGHGVDLDLLWVLKPRQGKDILGHSQVFEEDRNALTAASMVGVQRRALERAAADIAAEIQRQPRLSPAN